MDPVDPAPVDPAPVDPVDPAPVDPAPVDPVEPGPVDPVEVVLVVPEPFVTFDGLSSVEVGWPVLSGSGISGVEVFRDGVSIGVRDGLALTDVVFVGSGSVVYTAQSVGVDGSRSDLSDPVTFNPTVTGECVAVALNDGTTAITWTDAPDGEVTILDEVGGRYVPLEFAPRTETGIVYFVDSITEQAGQPNPDYRVTAVNAAGELSSQGCDGREFSDSEFERLSGIEFPVTDDGFIGGVSSNAAPQRVVQPDPPAALRGSPNPQEAPPACSAGGLFLDAERLDQMWMTIQVPAGTTVTYDAVSRSLEAGTGAWIWDLDAFQMNDDGTPGTGLSGRHAGSTSFYWGARWQPGLNAPHEGVDVVHRNDFPLFTAPESGTYLLRGEITFTQAGGDDRGASTRFEDFKFVAPDGSVTEPCELTDLFKCQVDGGNYFNNTGEDIALEDGTVLVDGGCYEHETCASTSYAQVIDQVARWACRNDALLDVALDIAVALLVVATVIYVAPAVSAAAVAGGAGFGLATTPWVCDQTDNGFLRPSLDLDPSCVATEVAIGGVLGPLGAGGNLGRAVSVGCLEGATSTAVYGYVNEDVDIGAGNVAIGTALGCATGGLIQSGLNSLPTRPANVSPTVSGSRRTFSSSSTPAPNGAAISLEEAAEAASRNGIDMRMFRLEFEANQPLNLYGFTSVNGLGEIFRSGDGRFIITLTDAGLSSPQAAVNTIAHELNHVREILNGPTGHFISDETAATAAGDLAEEFFQ